MKPSQLSLRQPLTWRWFRFCSETDSVYMDHIQGPPPAFVLYFHILFLIFLFIPAVRGEQQAYNLEIISIEADLTLQFNAPRALQSVESIATS